MHALSYMPRTLAMLVAGILLSTAAFAEPTLIDERIAEATSALHEADYASAISRLENLDAGDVLFCFVRLLFRSAYGYHGGF